MLKSPRPLCLLQQHHIMQASHTHTCELCTFNQVRGLADLGPVRIASFHSKLGGSTYGAQGGTEDTLIRIVLFHSKPSGST